MIGLNPQLALLIWFVLLVLLFRYDPARDPEQSSALWIPLIWLIIMSSRRPAQWLGQSGVSADEAYQDGNLLDRMVLLTLILLALRVLSTRRVVWGDLVGQNLALASFLLFALVSVSWSEEPLVSVRRWIRDLGTYLMIIVVLSDDRPFDAVRTLIRRVCYFLIPLSIVFIKYYPGFGVTYSVWTGQAMYVGVTTGKNNLGLLCVLSALYFFWDILARWSHRANVRTRKIILVDVAFIGMTLWLLRLANSATASVCLAVGLTIIVAAHSSFGKSNPGRLLKLVPSAIAFYLILNWAFEFNDLVIRALGKDPSLTGRTALWADLWSFETNPLVGTGYESFWLGERLKIIWRLHPWRPNQAHNGYLEVYLNLGLMGIALLGAVVISCYRRISAAFRDSIDLAKLMLAVWTTMLLFCTTEAGFKYPILWFIFLLATVAVPLAPQPAPRTVGRPARPPRAGLPIRRPST